MKFSRETVLENYQWLIHRLYFESVDWTDEGFKEAVDKQLAFLKDKRREMLQMRFGLLDGKRRTFQETGDEFGVGRQWVAQNIAKAFRQLRHPNHMREITPFVHFVGA